MSDPAAFLDTVQARLTRLAVMECVAENAVVFLLASDDPVKAKLVLAGLRAVAETRARNFPESQREEALRCIDELFKSAEAKWWATRTGRP